MLQINESNTIEEASKDLLEFVLQPENWVSLAQPVAPAAARPGESPHYQRRVGKIRVCTSVEVTATLEVILRVGFLGPGLSAMKAADHLETFLKRRLPLTPNTEWQVEVDARRWIHFTRKYAGAPLRG
jgi:hypothetical protein